MKSITAPILIQGKFNDDLLISRSRSSKSLKKKKSSDYDEKQHKEKVKHSERSERSHYDKGMSKDNGKRSRDKERERSREKERERSRDGERERSREKKRSRDKDKDKYNERFKEKDRQKEEERENDRKRDDKDRDKYKNRSRSRSHRIDYKDSDRNYDRYRKDRERDRDRRHSKDKRSGRKIHSPKNGHKSKKYEDFSKEFISPNAIPSNIVNETAPVSNSDPAKADRELYVANIPFGIGPNDLMQLLNNAMIAIGANLRSGNPIISAWMKENNQYAFLEFRTAEEANNAFKLDGISILDKVNISC